MVSQILLVEDSEDDAALFRFALKKMGVANSVFSVSNAEEALSYLKGEGAFADRDKFPLPGVLFLDLKLPGINGFEVLKWITTQPNLSSLFIVVLSGHDEVRHVGRAYALGARSFLVKPISELDIKNLMKAFPGYWVSPRGSASPENGR